MSTFTVTLAREVTTIERKAVQIEAEDMKDARHQARLLTSDTLLNSGWTETNALEAEVGDPTVESVKLHAYDEGATPSV